VRSPFSEHSCLQQPLLNPCYIHIGLLYAILSATRTFSLHVVLEASNGQDDADTNAECHGTRMLMEAVGRDSKVDVDRHYLAIPKFWTLIAMQLFTSDAYSGVT
jgi:tryptophan-rich sensory protein